MSLRLGYLTQPIEIGPGALGVDMVGGDRGDTAPIADAGIEEIAEVVGEVWWRLDVDVERQDHPGERNCVEIVGAGQGSALCIAVPALGRKFWTITSWTWPWRWWLAAIASSASMRSARFSPMPTRIPVV